MELGQRITKILQRCLRYGWLGAVLLLRRGVALLWRGALLVRLIMRVVRGQVRQQNMKLMKWLQMRHQALGMHANLKQASILLSPLIMLFVRLYGRRYRKQYADFGEAIGAFKRNQRANDGLLLVSGTLGPGGAERQAVVTFMGLAKRGLKPLGFAVVYLFTEYQRFYLSRLEAAGLTPTSFNRDESKDNEGELAKILTIAKLLPGEIQDVRDYIRTMLTHRPETVHLWLDEVNIKGGIAAVAIGAERIVLSVRNLPPYNFLLYQPYMREGYRWLIRQPGVTLVSNSAAGARAYEYWLEMPKYAIRVVHNGFDFDAKQLVESRDKRSSYRQRHGIPAEAPLIGAVFRLNQEKRPLLWVEIATRVARQIPAAHFLIIGDGPLRPQLETFRAHPELAGRLHVVGLEPQVLEAIAAMDLFLLTSFGEGLPNVLIEAQALGVPVVTTPAGGAPETLQHSKTGWVLENSNPRIAATIIVRLLKDKEWLRNAGIEARDFARRTFGVERLLDETLEVCGMKAGTRHGDENEAFLLERLAR